MLCSHAAPGCLGHRTCALLGQSEKKVEPKPAAEVKIAAAAAEKPRPAGKRGVATTDPIEILRQGGAVMYPLLACSVVGPAVLRGAW